ncbi:GNAT family N-acetyltransferase [Rhodococcus pyridinivorans]|uniref:GNAT family N-acetyltransferase n=1 Tax=Rhodococcus pyridinivorans TaxID=103816 RepID=UPI0022846F47|nr:GNAT family N-acetyltransferase [Rhodococcus pyridinivorans]WAL49864.1 GNAT family N-acetyltransferase [Rhodococcus pyridinivorans]
MYRPTLRYRPRHRARASPSSPLRPVTWDDLVVREATVDDLDATAHLHIEELPVGFFPDLGPRFMRRWHKTFLESPHAVAFVAVCRYGTDEVVCAFLMGSTDESAHMRVVLADRRCLLTLASIAALSLLRRPSQAVRFLRTRAWPWTRRLVSVVTSRSAVRPARTDPAPVALLAAVAVRPQLRGSGVGARLVELFLVHAHERGAATAELLTRTGPEGAGAFYEHLGWSAGHEHLSRDGVSVRSYRRCLGPPADPGTFCAGGGADL